MTLVEWDLNGSLEIQSRWLRWGGWGCVLLVLCLSGARDVAGIGHVRFSVLTFLLHTAREVLGYFGTYPRPSFPGLGLKLWGHGGKGGAGVRMRWDFQSALSG